MRTYHVGICKGGGYDLHRPDTLIVQATRSVDYLSCELWEYYGERETTKAQLRRNAADILRNVNQKHGTSFKRVIVE